MKKLFPFLLLVINTLMLSNKSDAQFYLTPDYATTVMNTSVTIDVRANDNPNPNCQYTVKYLPTNPVYQPQHGSFTILNYDSIVYTPNTGYVGTDAFYYAVYYQQNNNAACDTEHVYVNVTQAASNCQAYFTSSTNGLTATFTNASTGNFLMSYWSFGDGNTSSQTSPSHTYANPGTYNVCVYLLTSTSSSSICDSFCTNITVTSGSSGCTAAFNSTTSGLLAAFTNSSTGTYTTQYWTFGDGGTSPAASPTHTYANSGTYTVCLILFNGSVMCDSICQPVTVSSGSSGCQAYFTTNANALTATFTNASTGTYAMTYWSFGDGGTSSQSNPSHTYASAGTYHVCLYLFTSTSTSSLCDSFCTNITVAGSSSGCTANFTTATNALTANFTNISTGTYTSSYWSFGDGGTSPATSPSHTYTSAGTYTVCLILLNGTAFCDSTCKVITVSATPNCAASFTVVQNGPTTVFYNTSTPTGYSSYWNFGDNSSNSTQQNPTHTYVNAGSYVVCLYISVPGINCTSMFCDTVVISTNIGINEISTKSVQFKAIPNPANESVYIYLNEEATENVSWQLNDILGREMITGQLAAGKSSFAIDVKAYNPGMYILRINNGKTMGTGKILIKH